MLGPPRYCALIDPHCIYYLWHGASSQHGWLPAYSMTLARRPHPWMGIEEGKKKTQTDEINRERGRRGVVALGIKERGGGGEKRDA